jgi:hypothetical protein
MAGAFTPWGRSGDGAGAPGSSNGMAIAALACGIAGLFVLEIILGPLAIIFGAIALRRAGLGAGRRGMALAGLILGIIDVLALILILSVSPNHTFNWHAAGQLASFASR